MERSVSNKIPSGITVDIESVPKMSSSSSSDGYFSTNGKTSYTRLGLIVVILLFLGVNIFSYLGDFFQIVKEAIAPLLKNILESLGYVVTETTKDVAQLSAEGAKLGIDVAAGTVESGINVIQGQLDIDQGSASSSSSGNTNGQGQGQGQGQGKSKAFDSISSSLSSALADAEYNSEPMPDDSMSSTQRVGPGKSGYCYIGEDRGFRSCIQVKDSDMCMSGDIFPSQDICVNPSLRS
tara:strand:+ start:551 stop:1261 length:711 start_codon:yes stop_codon:yes gene_type:complete